MPIAATPSTGGASHTSGCQSCVARRKYRLMTTSAAGTVEGHGRHPRGLRPRHGEDRGDPRGDDREDRAGPRSSRRVVRVQGVGQAVGRVAGTMDGHRGGRSAASEAGLPMLASMTYPAPPSCRPRARSARPAPGRASPRPGDGTRRHAGGYLAGRVRRPAGPRSAPLGDAHPGPGGRGRIPSPDLGIVYVLVGTVRLFDGTGWLTAAARGLPARASRVHPRFRNEEGPASMLILFVPGAAARPTSRGSPPGPTRGTSRRTTSSPTCSAGTTRRPPEGLAAGLQQRLPRRPWLRVSAPGRTVAEPRRPHSDDAGAGSGPRSPAPEPPRRGSPSRGHPQQGDGPVADATSGAAVERGTAQPSDLRERDDRQVAGRRPARCRSEGSSSHTRRTRPCPRVSRALEPRSTRAPRGSRPRRPRGGHAIPRRARRRSRRI